MYFFLSVGIGKKLPTPRIRRVQFYAVGSSRRIRKTEKAVDTFHQFTSLVLDVVLVDQDQEVCKMKAFVTSSTCCLRQGIDKFNIFGTIGLIWYHWDIVS